MRNFWTNFFAFLIILLLLLYAYNPAFVQAALIFLGAWFMMLFYVVFAVVAAVPAVLLWLVYRKQKLAANRPVDGALPLLTYRTRDGRQIIVNPNHMVGASAIIDRRAGTYTEPEPSAGWGVQAGIRSLIERTNTARAIFPGDQARTNANGAMSRIPALGSLRAVESSTRAALPAPRVVGGDEPPMPPAAAAVSMTEAWRHNTPSAVAVGASIDSGQPVAWDLTAYPHARIHGATQGSGKTNLAKTALIAMTQQGAHVAILDRRRFKDFSAFNGKAELIDTSNPAAFVEVLRRLEHIYRERDRMLGAHGAANIDELPVRLVRYVIFVSEFGTLCSVADGAGLLGDVQPILGRIMAEAGAAGIHLIFEDQIVQRGQWPRGVAANAGAIFTGYLPLNLGAAGGYHHAHLLQPYQFHHAGETLQSWHIKPAERQLLASVPALDPRLAVLDGSVRPAGDGERSASSPPPHHTGTVDTWNDGTEEAGYWDEIVAAWFAAHPWALTGAPKGISDLARTMAEHHAGSAERYENYKSRAHRLYHDFRKSARLPGGQPLGVDITGGP